MSIDSTKDKDERMDFEFILKKQLDFNTVSNSVRIDKPSYAEVGDAELARQFKESEVEKYRNSAMTLSTKILETTAFAAPAHTRHRPKPSSLSLSPYSASSLTIRSKNEHFQRRPRQRSETGSFSNPVSRLVNDSELHVTSCHHSMHPPTNEVDNLGAEISRHHCSTETVTNNNSLLEGESGFISTNEVITLSRLDASRNQNIAISMKEPDSRAHVNLQEKMAGMSINVSATVKVKDVPIMDNCPDESSQHMELMENPNQSSSSSLKKHDYEGPGIHSTHMLKSVHPGNLPSADSCRRSYEGICETDQARVSKKIQTESNDKRANKMLKFFKKSRKVADYKSRLGANSPLFYTETASIATMTDEQSTDPADKSSNNTAKQSDSQHKNPVYLESFIPEIINSPCPGTSEETNCHTDTTTTVNDGKLHAQPEKSQDQTDMKMPPYKLGKCHLKYCQTACKETKVTADKQKFQSVLPSMLRDYKNTPKSTDVSICLDLHSDSNRAEMTGPLCLSSSGSINNPFREKLHLPTHSEDIAPASTAIKGNLRALKRECQIISPNYDLVSDSMKQLLKKESTTHAHNPCCISSRDQSKYKYSRVFGEHHRGRKVEMNSNLSQGNKAKTELKKEPLSLKPMKSSNGFTTRRNDSDNVFKCIVCKRSARQYLFALDQVYHQNCFRCYACHGIIPPNEAFNSSISNGIRQPMHRACHAELFGTKCTLCHKTLPIDPESGKITYIKHTFFSDEIMCPEHSATARRCTGCQRFEPVVGSGFADLGDKDRCVCPSCCRTVIVDNGDAKPLWESVLRFFREKLELPIWQGMEDVPVLIVGSETLSDSTNSQSSAHGGSSHLLTRGLCLTEHLPGSRIDIMPRMKYDSINKSFSYLDYGSDSSSQFVIPEICSPRGNVTSSVTAILCLSGLPSQLTASILAHEATHAWIKLHPLYSYLQPIPVQVEEGVCQLVAYLFLHEDMENQSYLPSEGGPSDHRLRQYFKFSIETDDNEIYGDGFRSASMAYSALGIEPLLSHIVRYREFPDV